VNWIQLIEDNSQWQTTVNTAMKLQVPQEAGDIFSWKMLYHGVVTLNRKPLLKLNDNILV